MEKSIITNYLQCSSDLDTYCLSPAQIWLTHYFSEPFEWYDRMLFSIEQTISIEAIQIAMFKLIERHDGLRTIFLREGKWKQKILPSVDKKLSLPLLFSAEGFSEEEYEKLRDGLCFRICKKFNICKWPLMKLIILKRSNRNYEVMFLFHHIIVDYIACMTIFKEFYTLYMSFFTGEEPNLRSILSNSKYAQTISGHASKDRVFEMKAYWQKEKLACHSKNLLSNIPSLESNSKKIEKTIPSDQAEVFLRCGKKYFGVKSLHYILVAPLYRAMSEVTKSERVTISHKLHGRDIASEKGNFFETVGNFAINVPVSCEVKNNKPWRYLIQALESSFSYLPLNGLSYDIACSDQNLVTYPDHLLTPIRFNYLGNISFVPPPGFRISFKEIARRVVHPNQPLTTFVEFFIHFFEKSLFIEVLYDGLRIKEKFIGDIFAQYLIHLDELSSILREKI